jgi:3-oxoacyl-[acyl-carrier-protein] synthase-3
MFRFAVQQGVEMLRQLSSVSGVALDDVSFVIPHQANLRIIRSMQEKTGIPQDRWIVDLQETGNTASASVLLALAHYLEKEQPRAGERGVVCGFGAGLTWAGMLIEW